MGFYEETCTNSRTTKNGNNLEHNKAWLLAESGGGAELTSTDLQSVHSSFRFSICSQVELDAVTANPLSSATVLMLNLDNGVSDDRAKESKWRRIESLERSISPVSNSLVRFNYGEIVSATRNFSKERVLGRGALSFVFRGRVGVLKTSVAIKRYLAPEYFQHGKVSDKTDVYAFGVALLELITGKKPIEARRPPGVENLVLWAKPLLQRGMEAVEDLLDPRLKRTLKNSSQIARTIQAAAACISNEELRRPSIDEIMLILRGGEEAFCSSRKKSNLSGVVDFYSQSQHSKSEMKSHLA
ncbi:pfkB-type carbohydrate kinase family protein [Hibiscus syriacus]|uniref:PfkB-type carbohydrate kinase family protein n=1 Tax=Hibiscus syriacus TaxID=106335 RepID=A0A6A2WUI2_HIBSY|nr:pfkB-type carbohydrate kinase family protein [Hibiscus syriacus]